MVRADAEQAHVQQVAVIAGEAAGMNQRTRATLVLVC